jgi:hypothetical protein
VVTVATRTATPLPLIDRLVVPAEQLRIGPIVRPRRQVDHPSLEGVVGPAVLVLIAEPAAYLETEVRRHCHVAPVEGRHDLVPREEPEAADGVVWALEPEEQRLPGLERPEDVAAGRLPEVHLLVRLALP